MTIQINSDKNLILKDAFADQIKNLLAEELDRFSNNITRLEVHLSDENGSKIGQNDKRCLIEARLEGKQPIAVTDMADTYDNAVDGAIIKLKASLETIIGRSRNQ